jgi:hypothetical protein
VLIRWFYDELNITTFIIQQLLYVSVLPPNPFKNCINNAGIPCCFISGFIQIIRFDKFKELMSTGEIVYRLGFLSGLVLFILFQFCILWLREGYSP